MFYLHQLPKISLYHLDVIPNDEKIFQLTLNINNYHQKQYGNHFTIHEIIHLTCLSTYLMFSDFALFHVIYCYKFSIK